MFRVSGLRHTCQWLVAVLLVAIVNIPQSSVALAAAPNWQATAGVDAVNNAVQANGFFPDSLWIHVGDSVTWTARSGEIHTVSFGIPPSFDILTLFSPAGGATYAGDSTFTSSGAIANGQGYTLNFTKAGDYHFQCYVHSTMQGILHVETAGAPLPYGQATYNEQANVQEHVLLAEALQVQGQGLVAALTSGTQPAVTAGIGKLNPTSSVASFRFQPASITAHVGQTVVFTNRDPEIPHTVTFNLDYANPFLAKAPSGTDGTDHATIGSSSQQVNSGFLGAPPLGQATQFSVTFTKPGIYRYDCAIHGDLGMQGTVNVLSR